VDPYETLARFYDLEHTDLNADLVFYLHYAQGAAGPVLELGCGSGRLLLPLAQAGIDLTGVDLSPAMLALARKKLGGRVELIEGDMCTLALPGRYALAIVSINSFMHLQTTAEQLAALGNIARHLQPGGRLIVDLPPGDELFHQDADARLTLERQFVDPATGHQIMKQVVSRIDWATQRQKVIHIYDELLPDGTLKRTVVPMTLRHVFRYELALLLDKSGYTLESLYGDYDLSPYESGCPRMIAVARLAKQQQG
jgi:SAM-dependent methyltransferase